MLQRGQGIQDLISVVLVVQEVGVALSTPLSCLLCLCLKHRGGLVHAQVVGNVQELQTGHFLQEREVINHQQVLSGKVQRLNLFQSLSALVSCVEKHGPLAGLASEVGVEDLELVEVVANDIEVGAVLHHRVTV